MKHFLAFYCKITLVLYKKTFYKRMGAYPKSLVISLLKEVLNSFNGWSKEITSVKLCQAGLRNVTFCF